VANKELTPTIFKIKELTKQKPQKHPEIPPLFPRFALDLSQNHQLSTHFFPVFTALPDLNPRPQTPDPIPELPVRNPG
jgi:hypothetical protein